MAFQCTSGLGCPSTSGSLILTHGISGHRIAKYFIPAHPFLDGTKEEIVSDSYARQSVVSVLGKLELADHLLCEDYPRFEACKDQNTARVSH